MENIFKIITIFFKYLTKMAVNYIVYVYLLIILFVHILLDFNFLTIDYPFCQYFCQVSALTYCTCKAVD